MAFIVSSKEDGESEGFFGKVSVEVADWFRGVGWISVNNWGNMNDWGEDDGVLVCDACSVGIGSILCAGWGECTHSDMDLVVVVFVECFVNSNKRWEVVCVMGNVLEGWRLHLLLCDGRCHI